MNEDATFEDGAERALDLGAVDAEDLGVISALVQDAVLPGSEMRFERGARRFAMLVNRFRWEDTAGREGRHAPERVRAVLAFENVTAVASQGIARDADTVLSLLSVEWAETDAPAGDLLLTFAGDGALRLSVEALEVRLKDVERPYRAVSGKAPGHND